MTSGRGTATGGRDEGRRGDGTMIIFFTLEDDGSSLPSDVVERSDMQ